MNKTDARKLLKLFREAKPLLAIRGGTPGKIDFICIALSRAGAYTNPSTPWLLISKARGIVMRSIAPHRTYDDWLRANGSPKIGKHQAQRERHRFIDACITELERRVK